MDFFGKQIEQERKLAGLSVLELSQKTGLSEERLMKLESGDAFPDVRELTTIAKSLGRKQGYFFTKIVY